MKNPYDLDPEHPADSRQVQDALLESLAPCTLAPERANAIKERLLRRIGESRESGKGCIQVRLDEGAWEILVPGVRVKRLMGGQRAALLELAPGSVIPFHRHHEDEECVVLRGEAQLGDVRVRAGDYHLATTGSRHGAVRSATGALLFLRGTPIGNGMEVARDVLTALLPGRGDAPLTVPRDDGPWTEHSPGVQGKLLRDDGHSRSMLLRVAAGARLSLDARSAEGECLVIEGEAFLGDSLLRSGDYRLAPPGSPAAAVSSDVGALLFLRGPGDTTGMERAGR